MKTLLLFPTPYEAQKVFALFIGKTALPKLGAHGRFAVGDKEFCTLVCGIGCQETFNRVAKFVKNSAPQKIVLMGFCGACDPSLKAGDAVFETSDGEIANVCLALNMRRGEISTFESVADRAAKARLFEDKKALGVDMEGALVKEIAAVRGIPFANIRIVSDAAEDDVPAEFLEAMQDKRTGALKILNRRTAFAMLFSPSLILRLIRFGKSCAGVKRTYDKAVENFVFEFSK